jgi:hypothetical protein
MTLNDHVMREIQSFQTIERDFFLNPNVPEDTAARSSRH